MKTSSNLYYRFVNLFVELRHIVIAGAVFLNGFMIVLDVLKLPDTLSSLFDVQNIVALHISHLVSGPWLLLGSLLIINSFGLLYRARLAWAVSVVLLLITFAFTMQFYPHLQGRAIGIVVTLLLLVIGKQEFIRSSATAGSIFAVISFIVLLCYSTYGSLYFGDGFKPPIHNILTAFYFSIVTMTTVGYGDIVPISDSARTFTASMIVAGITVFATSLTTVIGPILHKGLNRLIRTKEISMIREDHFIVCGLSSMATSTIMQLHQRHLPLTLIASQQREELTQLEQRVDDTLDIIIGDSTDDVILKSAGVQDCRALLALSEDDAFNAFVVLTAREINRDIKTVLVVNDTKNIHKVKQVKADVVLSPQLFGSEILACVMTGEDLDHDRLISMLLTSGHGLFSKKPVE